MSSSFPFLVKQNPETLNWHVEHQREDGELSWAIFLGKDAEDRAKKYAAMMNRLSLKLEVPHA